MSGSPELPSTKPLALPARVADGPRTPAEDLALAVLRGDPSAIPPLIDAAAEQFQADASGVESRFDNFREWMEAANTGDPESGHAAADEVMCEELRRLGYGAGVEVFERMRKWYA